MSSTENTSQISGNELYTAHDRMPHINSGTLGHVDHGKTTFTASITSVFSKMFPGINKSYAFDQIDKSPEEKARGITIQATTVEYTTDWTSSTLDAHPDLKARVATLLENGMSPRRHTSHVDCPGHADFIKNMVTGASQMDFAILVVSAVDGIMPQTREHILLASRVGVKRIAIFMNKLDVIPEDELELVDMVVSEIEDLLKKHGFPVGDMNNPNIAAADKLIIAKGSAMKALEGDAHFTKIIIEFFLNIDAYIATPPRLTDKPFFMSADGVLSISGRGTVVTGCINRGTITVGEEIEIVGRNDTAGLPVIKKAVVTGVEAFKKALKAGLAGDNVGILLRGVDREDVERGMFLVKPKSVTLSSGARISLVLLTKEEGGRHTPITSGYRPQLYYCTGNYAIELHIISIGEKAVDANASAMPGDYLEAYVSLNQSIPLIIGDGIAIREGGKTVGSGKIIDLIATKEDFDKLIAERVGK